MPDPIAQGQPAGAPNPSSDAAAPKPPDAAGAGNEGFQKRIDELTAARHDAERRAQQMQAQYEALAAQQPQPTPQPPVQIDPNIAAQMQALMGPMLQQLQQGYQQLQQTMGHQQLQQSVQQLQVPEQVAKRAADIMREYGLRNQYVAPETARRYALGELWEQEQLAKLKDTTRQNFNGHGAPLTSSGVPAALSAGPARPANFDSLPLNEQLRWYESNVGDKPL